MTRDQILEVIRQNVAEIEPAVAGQLSQCASWSSLGLDSMERSELIMMTLDDLSTRIPILEFAGASNICEMADIIARFL
ncbi:MAG: phosphopantetheine-binding protein [Pseudomonadota bacterium]